MLVANPASRILALYSHFRCPSVRPSVRPSVLKRDIPPYLHYMTFQTIQTKYFLKAYDIHYPLTHHHSLVTQIQIHKYTNTQIHKYTNTASFGQSCTQIKRLFTFEFILDFFVETACILYLYLLLHCCIATKSNG